MTLHAGAQDAALIAADGRCVGRQVVERLRVFARAQATDQIEDIHPAARADHAIQPLHLSCKLGAVALRHAAGGDQVLIGAFVAG